MPTNGPQNNGNLQDGGFQQQPMQPMQQSIQQPAQQPMQPQGFQQPYNPQMFQPMGNGMEEPEEEEKRSKGFYIGIAIAAVAIIALIVFAIFMFMNSTQGNTSNRGGQLGQLDGKTTEEIQAELDRIVEEGMFNISIASAVQFEDGESEGEIKIENSPANHYLMQVDIVDQATGDVVYTSDILEPNYHVQTAKLDKDLDPGIYHCIATFHALDPDTEEEVGQAAAQVVISVMN